MFFLQRLTSLLFLIIIVEIVGQRNNKKDYPTDKKKKSAHINESIQNIAPQLPGIQIE
jgi:hypothetical protein